MLREKGNVNTWTVQNAFRTDEVLLCIHIRIGIWYVVLFEYDLLRFKFAVESINLTTIPPGLFGFRHYYALEDKSMEFQYLERNKVNRVLVVWMQWPYKTRAVKYFFFFEIKRLLLGLRTPIIRRWFEISPWFRTFITVMFDNKLNVSC